MPTTPLVRFRVIQLYQDCIIADVIRGPDEAITLGVHAGCDLLSPLPGHAASHTLFAADDEGQWTLRLPEGPDGAPLLDGEIKLGEGPAGRAADLADRHQNLPLRRGDWGRLSVAEAPGVELVFQYVTLPRAAPGALWGSRWVRGRAVLATASREVLDEYQALAAVAVGVFLLLCFLAAPHGPEMESQKRSLRMASAVPGSRPADQARKPPPRPIPRAALPLPKFMRQGGRSGTVQDRRPTRPRRGPRSPRPDLRRSGHLGIVGKIIRDLLGKSPLASFDDLNKLSGKDVAAGGPDDVLEGPGGRPRGGDAGDVRRTVYGTRLMVPKVRNIGQPNLPRNMGPHAPPAAKDLGRTTMTGRSLSSGQILKTVKRHQGSVKYCYENAIRVKPEMGGGKVVIRWKIAPGGKVIGATIVSAKFTGARKVASCLTRALRRWRFPASSGYSVVTMPFLFSSSLN